MRGALEDDRPADIETRVRVSSITETPDGAIAIIGSTTWPRAPNNARRVDVWLRKITVR